MKEVLQEADCRKVKAGAEHIDEKGMVTPAEAKKEWRRINGE